MNPVRLFAAALLLVATSLTGISNASAELAEGRDYTVLPRPQPSRCSSSFPLPIALTSS